MCRGRIYDSVFKGLAGKKSYRNFRCFCFGLNQFAFKETYKEKKGGYTNNFTIPKAMSFISKY